jgi:hypothetical protein
MKKIVIALLAACSIAAVLTLNSCTRQQTLTPTQQLVGKWTMKTAIGYYITQGVPSRDTARFTPADYFQFNADGTVAIMDTGQPHNGNWKIVNNKLFFTNTNYIDYAGGFDMPILNTSTLQLHYTETTTITFLDQTLNFSR